MSTLRGLVLDTKEKIQDAFDAWTDTDWLFRAVSLLAVVAIVIIIAMVANGGITLEAWRQ